MENGHEPATKRDLAALKSELLEAIHQQLAEAIHESETRLLKAFYGFAESNHKRVNEIEGNQGAMLSRLATVEARLMEIEKRLNMPPQR